MITLAFQGRHIRNVAHVPGITLKDVLNEAEEAANGRATMTVNGEMAEPSTPIPDTSTVVVAPNIKNG